jgi:hypothetical protein
MRRSPAGEALELRFHLALESAAAEDALLAQAEPGLLD